MRLDGRFTGCFLYFYTMLYAKMFHGYDILKHCHCQKTRLTFTEKGCHFLDS